MAKGVNGLWAFQKFSDIFWHASFFDKKSSWEYSKNIVVWITLSILTSLATPIHWEFSERTPWVGGAKEVKIEKVIPKKGNRLHEKYVFQKRTKECPEHAGVHASNL